MAGSTREEREWGCIPKTIVLHHYNLSVMDRCPPVSVGLSLLGSSLGSGPSRITETHVCLGVLPSFVIFVSVSVYGFSHGGGVGRSES